MMVALKSALMAGLAMVFTAIADLGAAQETAPPAKHEQETAIKECQSCTARHVALQKLQAKRTGQDSEKALTVLPPPTATWSVPSVTE